MRPGRSDIAAPEFGPGLAWVGSDRQSMQRLAAAGPVLVQFFDFAQLNSVRALPYIDQWHRRYAEAGLGVIGVQAPRFPFGADPDLVAAGLGRLGVSFPVAIDAERELWIDYGCEGWPSLFLWGRGGVLRWFHFGEGEYLATEQAIQEELRTLSALRRLPRPMSPLRPTDAPEARVMPPSPELFPGGSEVRPWTAGPDGEEISLDYEAGGAYATVEGSGGLRVKLDGDELGAVEVDGPFLYELASHPRHESHRLVIRPADGLSVWSISFAAGVP